MADPSLSLPQLFIWHTVLNCKRHFIRYWMECMLNFLLLIVTSDVYVGQDVAICVCVCVFVFIVVCTTVYIQQGCLLHCAVLPVVTTMYTVTCFLSSSSAVQKWKHPGCCADLPSSEPQDHITSEKDPAIGLLAISSSSRRGHMKPYHNLQPSFPLHHKLWWCLYYHTMNFDVPTPITPIYRYSLYRRRDNWVGLVGWCWLILTAARELLQHRAAEEFFPSWEINNKPQNWRFFASACKQWHNILLWPTFKFVMA